VKVTFISREPGVRAKLLYGVRQSAIYTGVANLTAGRTAAIVIYYPDSVLPKIEQILGYMDGQNRNPEVHIEKIGEKANVYVIFRVNVDPNFIFDLLVDEEVEGIDFKQVGRESVIELLMVAQASISKGSLANFSQVFDRDQKFDVIVGRPMGYRNAEPRWQKTLAVYEQKAPKLPV